MVKRLLSTSDAFDLRQALHVAVLEALVAARRWEPGDLVFQGGTSLHLVHGSPRFSEDLDFLVKQSLDLSFIASAVPPMVTSNACGLRSSLAWVTDSLASTGIHGLVPTRAWDWPAESFRCRRSFLHRLALRERVAALAAPAALRSDGHDGDA